MIAPPQPAEARRRLMPGDWVEVRPLQEIAATLDADGRLGGLPFMPEMQAYCGRRLRVFRRADKTCAVAEQASIRRMDEAVHLADARCDGAAHGGCQNGCLLFWKEAWLRPVDGPGPQPTGGDPQAPEGQAPDGQTPDADAPRLVTSLTGLGGETIYVCQATELWRATCPLAWYSPRQYARDLRSGRATPLGLVRGLLATINSRLEKLRRRVWGRAGRTPTERLDLLPGELVEVRPRREIDATLDAGGHNRGLWWDPEMYQHCGQRFRVLRRLDQVIDEGAGTMRRFKQPAILLEGVVCTGESHRFCPRSSYVYWREIWLRRV